MLLDEYRGYYTDTVDREELLNMAESLPAMPSVASRALQLIDDSNITTTELANILSKDAGLTARLLKMSNSVAFSQQQEVTTLEQATSVIGLSGLRALVVASVMRGLKSQFGGLEQMVWQNSLATAMAAQSNTDWFSPEQTDDLFICGLLHNLGQLVFLAHPDCANRYHEVYLSVEEYDREFTDAELERIGFSYPLIGALGANRWGLPKIVSHVVLHHNDPFEGVDSLEDELATMVNLSRYVVKKAEIGYSHGLMVDEEQALRMAQALGVSGAQFQEYLLTKSHQLKDRFAGEIQAFQN